MKPTKPSKIQTVKATKLDPISRSTRTLRVIDHTVRGAFITLSVTILSLSFLGAAAAIFNTSPTDYAKAQSVPTDPAIGSVELPGSKATAPYITITSITKSGNNLQVAFTKNTAAQTAGNKANFNFKINSVISQPALTYDGASPYVLTSSLVPAGATEICVLVIQGNDALYANSGNCAAIPTTTTPTTGIGTPAIDTPLTPPITGEIIGVGPDGTESVKTTAGTAEITAVDPKIAQTQALNVAQASGTTARSGGMAFVSGLVLLSIVGYYVYYKAKGDRKSILKMAEKRIKLKK